MPVRHNAFREFGVVVLEGHCENSPAFQRWAVRIDNPRVPEGRQKPEGETQFSAVPPGLVSLPASTQR